MSTIAGDQSERAWDKLLREAAEWHVVLHSGETDDEDRRLFTTWFADPDNARAYDELEAVWGRFDPATSSPARQTLRRVLEDGNDDRQGRRQLAAIVTCGLFILLSGLGAVMQSYRPTPTGVTLTHYLSLDYLFSDHKTGLGEQRTVVLPDQTRVTLNSFSAIDIDYSTGERQVRLLQGEINLEVASEPERPLRVVSKHGTATALGTRYSVYDRGNATEVTVTESRVEVCAPQISGLHRCERLGAGQRTLIEHDGVTTPEPVDPGFEYDWDARTLVVENQPLSRVLDEIGRYRWGVIRINRNELADLDVSGVFPLDDPKLALAVLARSLPIEIAHYSSLLTVVSKK